MLKYFKKIKSRQLYSQLTKDEFTCQSTKAVQFYMDAKGCAVIITI